MRCFGRDKELRRCMRGIHSGTRASRFLLVRGPGGVGKTSLIVDGLIPWLRQSNGELFHFEIVKVSGADSPSSIARACCDALCREYLNFFQGNRQSRSKLEAVRSELIQLSGSAPREAGRRLAALVREWEADEGTGNRIRFLLLVDGLSRLLEERAATGIGPGSVFDEVADPFGFFFELGSMNSLVIALTYRDWIHKYVLRGLRQSGIGASEYSGLSLEWPAPEMMAEIVRNGVRVRGQKGGGVWDPKLVEALVDDFCRSPKCLSYLLPVLDAIEKEAAALEKQVCLLDYTGLGRLPGFIAAYAESLFSGSDSSAAESWAYLFSKFDERSKQGQRLDHLSIPMPGIERVEEARLWRLVSLLTDRRLLAIEEGDKTREAMVEPLHPVLLTDWDRAGEWLNDYRPILAQVEQFEKQGRSWESSKRDPRLLLNVESSLSAARQILKRDEEVPLLTPQLREYLSLSLDKRKKNARQQRRTVNTVVTLGIVAFVLMIGFLLEPVLGVSDNLRKFFGKSSLVEKLLLSSDAKMLPAPAVMPANAPKPKAPPTTKPKTAPSPPVAKAPQPAKASPPPAQAAKNKRPGKGNSPARAPELKFLSGNRSPDGKAAPSADSSSSPTAAGQHSQGTQDVPAGVGAVAGKVAPVAEAMKTGAGGEAAVEPENVAGNEAGEFAGESPAPAPVPGMAAATPVAEGFKTADRSQGFVPPPASAAEAPVVAAANPAEAVGAPVLASAGDDPRPEVPESIRKLAEALAERARKEREEGAGSGGISRGGSGVIPALDIVPVSMASANPAGPPPVAAPDGTEAAPAPELVGGNGVAHGTDLAVAEPAPNRSIGDLEHLVASFEQCQRDGNAIGAKAILKAFYEYFSPRGEFGEGEDRPAPLIQRPAPGIEEPFRASAVEFRLLAIALGDFFGLIGDTTGADFARRHPAVLPSTEPRGPENLDRDVRLLLARAALKAGNPAEAGRFFGRQDSSEAMASEMAAIRAALRWAFGEKESAIGDFRALVEMTPEFSLPDTIQALPWSEDARAVLGELRQEALR